MRVFLFLLLVVALPTGAYWAGQGFRPPDETLDRFRSQVGELPGRRNTPPTKKTKKEREPERPAETPAPSGKGPDETLPAEPKRGTEDGDAASGKADPEPASEPDPLVRAHEAFSAGRFEEAAGLFTGRDPIRRGWSRLGAAFARAFPTKLPAGTYTVLTARGGDTIEGFAQKTSAGVRIVEITGRSQTYPRAAITRQRPVAADLVAQRIADRIRIEGEAAGTSGPRLFALVQGAFRAGRPEAAASLLERLLRKDEEKPFFLSAVRNRVGSVHQKDLYRVFAQCELAKIDVEEPHELIREDPVEGRPDTPPERVRPERPASGRLKLDGNAGRKKRRAGLKGVQDKRALALLKKAGPLRALGLKRYRELVVRGVDKTDTAGLDEVIEPLQDALDLYQDAVQIEDHDDIYALIRPCSRMLFQLRFWKQQKHGG